MMKILVNLSSQKSGGGLTVATNFVSSVVNNPKIFGKLIFLFVISKGSPLKEIIKSYNYNYLEISSNPLKRIFTELIYISIIIKIKKIDVIYNYFHYGIYLTNKKQIIGTADSNIYYPEISFWNNISVLTRIKKVIIDKYRIYGIKKAHGVIFENPNLLERGKKIYNLSNAILIKPAVESLKKNIKSQDFSKRSYTGLFLCSWQENKNYKLIPDILISAKKMNFPLKIIFTAPLDNSKDHIQFSNKIKRLGLEKNIEMPGVVLKKELPILYSKIDFVFLLSNLESFSNNIIESWYYKKILIVSDKEWARCICGESAVYVRRNDPNNIISNLTDLLNDKKRISYLLSSGFSKIKDYNTPLSKSIEEMNFVTKIFEDK